MLAQNVDEGTQDSRFLPRAMIMLNACMLAAKRKGRPRFVAGHQKNGFGTPLAITLAAAARRASADG